MWIQQALALVPPNTWALADLTASAHSPAAGTAALTGFGWGDQELVISLDGDSHVQACRSQPASRGGAVIASPGSAAQANEERAAVAG